MGALCCFGEILTSGSSYFLFLLFGMVTSKIGTWIAVPSGLHWNVTLPRTSVTILAKISQHPVFHIFLSSFRYFLLISILPPCFVNCIPYCNGSSTNTEIFLFFSSLPLLSTTFYWVTRTKVKVLVAQSCPTLCDPMDCSPRGSSVHGILQARTLEWVAMPFSSGSLWPRDWTWVSRIVGQFFTIWATREAQRYILNIYWMLIDFILSAIKYLWCIYTESQTSCWTHVKWN